MESEPANGPLLKPVGNYELIAKIAEGGMGWVYKGKHRDTGQIVAIKIIPSTMTKNEMLLKRFQNEWQAASSIDHPNIVRALDYCGTGETPFLVMEFVDGESLGQMLDRVQKLPEHDAIRLIAQAAQGLHRAHKMGLIHRDVKPDNIMVTHDGIAKLTDLGLVKDTEAEMNLTRTGRGLGTPHFMAPEQFRNAKNADARCDIYSLGATLYMMVTGELPFGKTSGPLDAWMKKTRNELPAPRKLVPELSERVDWAIRRSMSSDPALRPSTCREFVEDLTGQSTRKVVPPSDQGEIQPQDLWYLVYKDETGETHTVKGSTEGIRRSVKERLLGDAEQVRACRTKQGPFEPLKTFPEFRDLMLVPGVPGDPNAIAAITGSKHGGGKPPSSKPPMPVATTGPEASKPPHIRLRETGDAEPVSSWLTIVFLVVLTLATAGAALYIFYLGKH
jgi:serine/threonine protein kinase